jgi:HK97 family phage portal protein
MFKLGSITGWFRGVSRKTVDISQIFAIMAGNDASITDSFGSYARLGYCANADVFACVREIATAVRGIQWVVKRRQRDGRMVAAPDHQLARLIGRPNPRMGGAQFFEALVSYHLIAGNAFIFRAGPDDTRRPPQSLWLIRPDMVSPRTGQRMGELLGWDYNGSLHSPELICDFPYFNPLSEWHGMSPLRSAARSVDMGNLGRSWNYHLMQNSARPPGGLSTDQSLDQGTRDYLETRLHNRWAGPENAGRPLILDSGLKWQSFGLTPAEMEWLSTQRFTTEDISKVYNVPTQLISDSANKTYQNYGEARKALYHETILPLMDFIRDELNAWLTVLYGDDVYLDYDRDDIEALQEDRDAIWQRVKGAIECGMMSPAEGRQEVGLPESDDPNLARYYVSRNLVPIELAGTQSAMPLLSETGQKTHSCSHHETKTLPPMDGKQKTLAGAIEKLLAAQRDEVLANVAKEVGDK